MNEEDNQIEEFETESEERHEQISNVEDGLEYRPLSFLRESLSSGDVLSQL